MKSYRPFAFAVLLAAGCNELKPSQGVDRTTLALDEARRIAVLDGGRYKPLDSYAREFVVDMTGDFNPKRYDAAGDEIVITDDKAKPRRPRPLVTYLEWIFDSDAARTQRTILIGDAAMQQRLGVAASRPSDRFASYEALAKNEKFQRTVSDIAAVKRENWTPEQAEVMQLASRWRRFGYETGLSDGGGHVVGPNVVPPPGAKKPGETYEWRTVADVAASTLR